MVKKAKGVLICGKMYSGKTTILDYYIYNGAMRLSFARKLKELAGEHYNNGEYVDKAALYPVYDNEQGVWKKVTGRTLLQELAESIKSFDYSFFYVEEANKINNMIKEGTFDIEKDIFVLDDCRFSNEYDYFNENFDITLVYVHTDDEIRMSRAMSRDGKVPTDHEQQAPSEQVGWAKELADIVIVNNFSELDALFAEVERKLG